MRQQFNTVNQIENLVGDVNVALSNINDSLNILENIDWAELMSFVPQSEGIHGDIERAIDNIKDNLRDMERGVD